jgi:Permeases
MNHFFKLKEHGTTVGTEVMAGLTTFFAMSYILFVNPDILSQSGLAWGAVFLATVFASFIGTMFMGLFANVPYALAPGMGLNAYFTFTVCFGLGFTPIEALALVFFCGVINVLITVTKIRKHIVKSIPVSLQHAIGGGVGIFIAYIGLLNIGLINFGAGVPGLSGFVPADGGDYSIILAVIGLILTVILMMKKVKGAILIGILATTVIGIPLGVVDVSNISFDLSIYGEFFNEFFATFGKALGPEGLGSLFADPSRYASVFAATFAFSLTDTFDTIGTFIGTGRRTGIFTAEDEKQLETGKGFSSKMDKALFADSIATSIGAILGTSNTTTYVESSAGIEAGGKTGLTAVTVAICFLASIVLLPVVGLVPSAATAPALIIVGILMSGAFADIKWNDFEEAVPAFFSACVTALVYSISDGIAFGFIFYIIVKACKGKFNEIHPILWVSTALFCISFIL